MAFEDNQILFGHDPEQRLLAVELAGPDTVELFVRAEDGALLRRKEPLSPVAWVSGSVPLERVEYQTLAGKEALGFLAVCGDWPTFVKLRTALRDAGIANHAPAKRQNALQRIAV
jgi:hypothetical protein